MPVITSGNFPTLFNSTRADLLTGPDYLVNLVQRVAYPFFDLVRGRQPFEITKSGGGTTITEVVKVSRMNNSGGYTPGDQGTPSGPDCTAVLSYPWRLKRTPNKWTDFEYDANTQSGGNKAQVKRFAKIKDVDTEDEHCQMLDNLLFNLPDYTSMEGTPGAGTGGEVYSLPAIISENSGSVTGATHLPPSTAWGTSTLFLRDPATNADHRNKVSQYNAGTPFDASNGILAAFDDIMPQLIYGTLTEAPNATQATDSGDLVVFTNRNGYTLLKQAARVGNDRWSDPSDGGVSFARPKFDGVPVTYCPQLDTALLEQTLGASAAYAGTAYGAGRPRFFIVNRKYLKPVFMEGSVMKKHPAARDPVNYPDSTVTWTTSTLNTVCNARNRQGIVAPL